MASSEQIGDQDQNIKSFVEQAVQKVREEFAAHLTDLRHQLGLAEKEPRPVAAESPQELFAAIADIDGARSQAEILSTLLDRACRFAGRSALFLTRQDGLHGWAGSGFNASSQNVGDLVMGYGEGTPWSRVATGHGGVSLTGSECAGMCARIDGSHPAEGILIPMVLRDQLAAAVYADRLEDEGSIDLMALQLLTYVAAQAIETLPLRDRPTTVTLRLFEDSQLSEPGLDLWSTVTAPATAPPAMETEIIAREPVVPEVPTVEVVPPEIEPVAPEPAIPEIPTVEVVPPEIETVIPEPAIPEVPTVEEVPEVEVPTETIAQSWEDDEVVQEDIAPMATAVPEPEVEEVGVEIEELPSPLDTGELQPFASTGFTLEGTEEAEVEVEAEPLMEMGEETATSTEPTQTFATGDYVSPEVAPPPPATIEPTEAIIPTVEAEPETVEPEPEIEPTVAIPPPAAPPAARPAARAATEIAPPEDLDGPGWAFTTSQIPADTGDDSLHEEAQRLARLLVTEIKLYNEEEVEEGRRNRNIYQTLREDINRSRQIYEERIDEKIRAETDYFHEELVRILAGGDADALGM